MRKVLILWIPVLLATALSPSLPDDSPPTKASLAARLTLLAQVPGRPWVQRGEWQVLRDLLSPDGKRRAVICRPPAVEQTSRPFYDWGRTYVWETVLYGGLVVLADGVAVGYPVDDVRSPRFSPDGRRFGYLARRGAQRFAVVDGREGQIYDDVGDTLLFSPDSRHVAYVAKRGPERFVVVDEREGRSFDWVEPGSLAFIGDGGTLTYTSKRGDKQFGVIDGEEYEVSDAATFRSGGRRTAHVTRRRVALDGHGYADKECVVLDGVEGPAYDEVAGLTLSSDGQHVTYCARTGREWFAVADGIEGQAWDSEPSLVVSPDGRRVACQFLSASPPFITLDGEKQKEYPSILAATFSPDSRRFAYLAKRGRSGSVLDALEAHYNPFTRARRRLGRFLCVVDGVEGPEYDWIDVTSVRFSPDSKSIVYRAKRRTTSLLIYGAKEYEGASEPVYDASNQHVAFSVSRGRRGLVVTDGLEGPEFDSISPNTITFSPDGRRIGYVAATRGKHRAVVDGIEGPVYDRVYSVTFSPDNKHVAYWGERNGKWCISVDGVECAEQDELRPAFPIPVFFDGPRVIRGVAVRGRDLLQVEIEAMAE